MEEQDRAISAGDGITGHPTRHATSAGARPPVEALHIPRHLAIAETSDAGQDLRIAGPGAERAAEPRPGVDACDRDDRSLGCTDIRAETRRGEERHPGMVEGVVPDQVAALGDGPGERRIRLRPATLDEEGRRDTF